MKKKVILQLFVALIIFGGLIHTIYAKNTFTDLAGYDWAKEYIDKFAEKGIVSGTSKETFAPGNNVKREEFVKVIVNTFGYSTQNVSCNFSDVKRNDWFYPYIAAATNAGIINGIGDNQFGAGAYITRQDICTIIDRVLQDKGYELPESKTENLTFSDRSFISSYALDAVEKLYKAEIINGIDEYHFSPKIFANRAQMVKIIYLADKYKIEINEEENQEPENQEPENQEPENQVEKKTDVFVQSIQLNSKEIILLEGESIRLYHEIIPQDATNQKVQWSSSNTKVATVYEGTVIALKSGTAIISVKTVDGKKTASCTVTVKELAPTNSDSMVLMGVTLNKLTMTVTVGESETLTATVSPSNVTNKNVIWNSSNPNIATVANGKVTGVKAGSTVITVTTVNEGKTANCTVTVKPATIEVTSVNLNKISTSIEIGKNETLTATVSPSNASNKSVTWSSNNEKVATVVNGKITGVSPGTAIITVKTVDGSKSVICVVTVTAETPSKTAGSISYKTTKINKKMGDSAFTNPLTYTGDGAVTYKSSNEKVATVNKTSGKVTIKGTGNATIIATVTDSAKYTYATKTASYEIEVRPLRVLFIGNSKTHVSIVRSATIQIAEKEKGLQFVGKPAKDPYHHINVNNPAKEIVGAFYTYTDGGAAFSGLYSDLKKNKSQLEAMQKLEIDYLVMQQGTKGIKDEKNSLAGAKNLINILYGVKNGKITRNKDMKIFVRNCWGWFARF